MGGAVHDLEARNVRVYDLKTRNAALISIVFAAATHAQRTLLIKRIHALQVREVAKIHLTLTRTAECCQESRDQTTSLLHIR
jgi:hypothetical protein